MNALPVPWRIQLVDHLLASIAHSGTTISSETSEVLGIAFPIGCYVDRAVPREKLQVFEDFVILDEA